MCSTFFGIFIILLMVVSPAASAQNQPDQAQAGGRSFEAANLEDILNHPDFTPPGQLRDKPDKTRGPPDHAQAGGRSFEAANLEDILNHPDFTPPGQIKDKTRGPPDHAQAGGKSFQAANLEDILNHPDFTPPGQLRDLPEQAQVKTDDKGKPDDKGKAFSFGGTLESAITFDIMESDGTTSTYGKQGYAIGNKSAGTGLPVTNSDKICGLSLCSEKMSTAEIIQQYLQSKGLD